MRYRDLNVLDAAEQAAKMVNDLIDRSPRGWLLHVQQLRDAVQSILANIAEGFGREAGRDRNRSLKIGRGETEEVIRHLRTNFVAHRVAPVDYWPLHNRFVVISKMLKGLMDSSP